MGLKAKGPAAEAQPYNKYVYIYYYYYYYYYYSYVRRLLLGPSVRKFLPGLDS